MIFIGSDHTGIDLKKRIIKYLEQKKVDIKDLTNFEDQAGDDYPDIAYIISKSVLNEDGIGIAICGTGIGISIACNKIIGIRAAVCTDKYMAHMARQDNNANILCIGSRLNNDNVMEIIDEFINTQFAGQRHQRRLDKISKIEKSQKEGVEYVNSL